MQETFYRIAMSLKNDDLTSKRLELLEKIEALKDELKKQGHTGRYGLKNLYCYAARPKLGHCITSIEHETGLPWLNSTIEEIRHDEIKNKKKYERLADKHITAFNNLNEDDKKQYLKKLDINEYKKLRIQKATVDNFIQQLKDNQKEKPVFNVNDFVVDELFVEPVKPSKKEYDIEKKYVTKLSPKEKIALNEVIAEKHPSETGWQPWKPGEKESKKDVFKSIVNKKIDNWQ